MKRRTKKLFILAIGLTIALTGCKSVAKEKDIQKDLELSSNSNVVDSDEQISNIKIEKRQTEKKQKKDIVWCTVTTEDADTSYEKQVKATYYLYDKGWELEEVSVNSSEDWIRTPLKGIDEENIPMSLEEREIKVNDGDVWEINPNKIKIKVKKQETNLDKKTDKVTLDVVLDDDVEEAKGVLVVDYKFEKSWKLDSVKQKEDFKASVKKDRALNLTEDDLIEALSKEKITLSGENVNAFNAEQDIMVSKEEVKDFKIESQKSTERGTKQELTCSCKLEKENSTYGLSINYIYAAGESKKWNQVSITTEFKLESINLQGEWIGNYDGIGTEGTATLNITAIEGNKITALYSYTPFQIGSYNEPGSYNVSGTIDRESMIMNLQAGDWVDEPDRPGSYEKCDIRAIYCIDEDKIEGLGQENSEIELKRSE